MILNGSGMGDIPVRVEGYQVGGDERKPFWVTGAIMNLQEMGLEVKPGEWLLRRAGNSVVTKMKDHLFQAAYFGKMWEVQ